MTVPRTRIELTTHGTVTLTYWNEDAWCRASESYGRLVVREFSAPSGHGYVREGERQVCERLHSTGQTLMASRDTLLSVIRREWGARRRSDQVTS